VRYKTLISSSINITTVNSNVQVCRTISARSPSSLSCYCRERKCYLWRCQKGTTNTKI